MLKTRNLEAILRFYIICPYICYRTLDSSAVHFLKKFSSLGGLKNRTTAKKFTIFSNSGVCWRSPEIDRIATYWAELMRRVLAPLRRIVSRELEVYATSRVSIHPASFVVHDKLECGHVHTSLLWELFDLTDPYTRSAHVRAIRHRCHECLTLAAKKPVQSVTLAKAKVA